MNIQLITDFFMWCTLINGGLMILWALFILFAPELVYKTQSRWIAISRANFDLLVYLFLGIFKLFFIFFNLIPFLALLIIG